MKTTRLLLSAIIALSLFIALFSIVSARPSIDPAAPAKIAPYVIDHTAHGESIEFFVILKDQADLSPARQLSNKIDKGNFVYHTLLAKAQQSQAQLIEYLDKQQVKHQSFYIVNALLIRGNQNLIKALANRSDVARIEGNPWVYNDLPKPIGALAPASPSTEPNIDYVHAPQVWSMGYTGTGIVIGNQDTGFQWDHPALIDQYRGWNGVSANHDYNWHDAIHEDTHGSSCGTDSPAPCDDYGHGTHTMGTAAGSGGIGMAPGAKWIGCRDMDNGWGKPSTYMECFQFFLAPYPVTGTYTQGIPALAPDVTTNSWSCPTDEGCSYNTLQAVVEAQRAADIMTVAAATNYGSGGCSTIYEPIALYDATYTIGALDTGTDSIASFSSRGPVTIDGSNRIKPDLSAPGTGIQSSVPGGGYGYESGTSMATPHVAGAVALLWSARPWLKHQIDATEQILNETAVPITTTECSSNGFPNNLYGYGRLDVYAAVLDQSPMLVPAQPFQANYPGNFVTTTVWITNTGLTTDTFEITQSSDWPATIVPTTTPPLFSGESMPLSASIFIPTVTLNITPNIMLIMATSQIDPSKFTTTQLTTIEILYQNWLPIINH